MSMHPAFPDWYRLVTVTPAEGVLQRRWKTVERLAQTPQLELITALLHLFSLPEVTETSAPADFVEAFRVDDETFPSKGNLYELRILAGAILRQIIEANGPGSTVASLGIVCTSFGARLSAIPERDHVDAAEKFLAKRGESIRNRGEPPPIRFSAMTKEKYSQLVPAASFQPNAIPQAHEQVFSVLSELMREISSSINLIQSAVDQQQHSIKVQDEELNLLWWLQTAFSRELQKRFEEIEPAAATVLFPMELSDLTVFVPGRNAIVGILSDAFRKLAMSGASTSLTLGQAVNATDRPWRQKVVARYRLGDDSELCPALLAVQKSLETDGAEDWHPVYRKASGIDADDKVEMLQLSLQFYRERMFLRALSEKQ